MKTCCDTCLYKLDSGYDYSYCKEIDKGVNDTYSHSDHDYFLCDPENFYCSFYERKNK
jgi:hypothetical protein